MLLQVLRCKASNSLLCLLCLMNECEQVLQTEPCCRVNVQCVLHSAAKVSKTNISSSMRNYYSHTLSKGMGDRVSHSLVSLNLYWDKLFCIHLHAHNLLQSSVSVMLWCDSWHEN